jgi:hypothetical protein
MQIAVAMGQLPLMDEYSRVGMPRKDVVLNLVEWHDDMTDRGLVKAEYQKRRRELTGDSDAASR